MPDKNRSKISAKKGKVSVIIPTYNVQDYVGECINSVLNQTYENIEIICVDDNSQDNTVMYIESIMETDKRIILLSNEENKGPAYSRNRGMDVATGEYIYFLDSDDFIDLNAIKILCNYAEKYRTECIYFNSKYLIETEGLGGPNLDYGLIDTYNVLYDGPTLFKILRKNDVYINALWRSFWRSDFLVNNEVKFVDGLYAEDALFCVKAILCANRVMIIGDNLHTYRRREGTLSTVDNPWKMISIFKNYCMLLDFWHKHQFSEEIDEVISGYLNSMLITAKRLYIKTKDEINKNIFNIGVERHLFEMLIVQDYDKSLNDIDTEVLKRILEFKVVIVFGAGRYAAEVVEKLKRKAIHIDHLAVTQMHKNVKGIGGIPVQEIKDLRYLKDDAIIVLGVCKNYRKDVIDTLNKYRFDNYISLEGEVRK